MAETEEVQLFDRVQSALEIDRYIGVALTGGPILDAEGKLVDWKSPSPDVLWDDRDVVAFTMPCGESYEWTRETFPAEDVPCRCGSEKCWAVKYEAPEYECLTDG